MLNTKSLTTNKILFLISTAFALCLFTVPFSLLILAEIFVFLIVVFLIFKFKPEIKPFNNKYLKILSISIAVLIELMGINTFTHIWNGIDLFVNLANNIHINSYLFVIAIGLLCGIFGFCSIYVLSIIITNNIVALIQPYIKETRKEFIAKNIKTNCFFLVSSVAFFCLNIREINQLLGIPISIILFMLIISQIPSIYEYTKNTLKFIKVLSFFTSLGICWLYQKEFFRGIVEKFISHNSKLYFGLSLETIVYIISIIGGVAAFLFVYTLLVYFWNNLFEIINIKTLFNDFNKCEFAIYLTLFILTVCFISFAFIKSNVFYEKKYMYNVIYTSDTPILLNPSSYAFISHNQNDIRQPLFACFAIPFVGLPYFLSLLFNLSEAAQTILIDSIQIVVLIFSNIVLAKMLKLSFGKRICFILTFSFTYTYLLFSLMMEQYIFAYSYLILFLYTIYEKKKGSNMLFIAAGGTLIMSLITLPLMLIRSIDIKVFTLKNFKILINDFFKYLIMFIITMLTFCRFDIIFNFSFQINALKGFAGKKISLCNKLYQYLTFIKNCFISPDAGFSYGKINPISWQLKPITAISILGIIILILCIISAYINRDKKISLVSIAWIGFSVVVLLFLGWGTAENGLILYSLYFGWPFFVLLFQLVEKMGDKLKNKAFLPVVSIGFTITLALINIPAIKELIDFAIKYYPT